MVKFRILMVIRRIRTRNCDDLIGGQSEKHWQKENKSSRMATRGRSRSQTLSCSSIIVSSVGCIELIHSLTTHSTWNRQTDATMCAVSLLCPVICDEFFVFPLACACCARNKKNLVYLDILDIFYTPIKYLSHSDGINMWIMMAIIDVFVCNAAGLKRALCWTFLTWKSERDITTGCSAHTFMQ